MRRGRIMKVKKNLDSCFQREIPEAGCDEAGRGCYAGPVFAAAVILPPDFFHPLLNDSKLVSAKIRQELRIHIEMNACAWAVARVEVEEIDRINILKASQKAMHLALDQLNPRPGFVAVDGNYFVPYRDLPYRCVIKGDGKLANIAAASILAKTSRDDYMRALHSQFPQYNWFRNKGYGTAEHRTAIARFGLSEHHRKSFNIVPVQTALF